MAEPAIFGCLEKLRFYFEDKEWCIEKAECTVEYMSISRCAATQSVGKKTIFQDALNLEGFSHSLPEQAHHHHAFQAKGQIASIA